MYVVNYKHLDIRPVANEDCALVRIPNSFRGRSRERCMRGTETKKNAEEHVEVSHTFTKNKRLSISVE